MAPCTATAPATTDAPATTNPAASVVAAPADGGSVRPTVWFVRWARAGRLHLDPSCEGLEKSDPLALGSRRARSLRALLADPARRPCRMCALEAAAVDALVRPVPSRPVWLTLASVPAERLGDAAADLSESGQARLGRIAAAAGWPTFPTAVGPVTAGATTTVTARRLCANLAGMVVAADPAGPSFGVDVDTGDVLAAAWSLCRARPVGAGNDRDLFALAAALAA